MLFRLIKIIVRFATLLCSIGLLISYTSSVIPPQKLWFIQLFGLAYPALLISTIALTIVNVLWNKKILFSLLALILGTFTHAKYFGVDFKSPNLESYSENEVKIMSFNARLFDAYKFLTPELSNSKSEFYDLFQSESPDILCIQEYAEDASNKRIISPEEIKESGGFQYSTTTMILELKNMFSGQAIYSKYPIIHSEIISDSTQTIRSLFADIVKGKDTIRVYNCHLESIRFQKDEYSLFDTEVASSKTYLSRIKGLVSKLKKAYPLRANQAQKIIDHILTSPYPVIISGDLNDPPTSYVYAMFDKHFSDAFYEGNLSMTRTYAGKVPAGRIDYIFHNEDFAPISFKTWKEKVLSDHYPIMASFKMR
ncbi:endonuclease/exonuclease/phosphatase family protein [Brumimicrobium oceani]|uniref:Endonuclease/exonuclease/phosphatase domain-containing protein n=1 Tax=Brumimicrobium oceani TaxID=2100725 RepID=A0A2U2XFI9_9FLAO|nr:endonuclease/exonuclease/phosphatase family protein [Brumimicrobium oceani]PWH86566.1 hypothetical protein DIT68_04850 [Brumimicrobium oceani]